ncbi:N-6 DNA methylase [Pseudomonas sp. I8001]|uniref:N-6 DNA methylase n=1 Tax=Pseudomonas sp. I8001 TaxID=2738825 RepID=UPI0015A354D6|nr:N-6 DNA methylase [Pseudomonas sp. I8001]
MQLTEEIVGIVEKRPLTASEIAEELNFRRSRKHSIIDVIDTVKKNQEVLQEINGKIISISNYKWKELIRAHWYLLSTLQANYKSHELHFLVIALFYYKRLIDTHEGHGATNESKSLINHNKNLSSKSILAAWLDSIESARNYQKDDLGLFNDFSSLLSKCPPEKLEDIINMIQQVDTLLFSKSEFSTAFEYILETRTPSAQKKYVTGTAPQVSELMAKLLNPKSGVVYDPVCGIGSLLSHVSRIADAQPYIKGSEIQNSIAQIALMNLEMHEIPNYEIISENCLNQIHDGLYYDFIIGDLPLTGFTSHVSPWKEKGFIPLLEFVISKLAEHGKAVLTVSDSFLLSQGKEQNYRDHLLHNDIIECIISLPAGSLKPYTNGKSSIIILNKSKPSFLINRIKFITAENLAPASQLPILDISSILGQYQEKNTDSLNSQIVSAEEVASQKSLSASYYTDEFKEAGKLLKGGKARKLGELVEIISGTITRDTQAVAEDTPFIKIESLEKDILDMRLSSGKSNSRIVKTKQSEKSLIREESLLIARIGDNLKPTIFKPSKMLPEIITHNGVLTLRPFPKSSLDIEYLYYQLYSPLIQKQVEQRRIGTVMPFISKRLLSEIIIPMMPLDSQREFIATQKSNLISAEKERVTQRLRAIGFEEENIQKENELISTLVHELRPKLVKINSLSNKLIRIIEKHNISSLAQYDKEELGVDDDLMGLLEQPENLDIGSVSQKIAINSKELNDTLSLVKEIMTLNLKPSEFIKTRLLNFLSEHLRDKTIERPHKYKIEIKGYDIEANIHQASILQVIDQLIANAEHHAFSAPSSKDRITFTVKEDKERKIAIIEYSNNGKPFTLTKSDYIQFFTKSKSSNGSGIGGNYIYRIIRAHDGDIEIDENKVKGFSMKIEIPNKEER